MPLTGFGTWQLRGAEATRAVSEAIRLGYRLIDTSGDYGNQPEIGKVIKSCGISRQDLFVVTKIEEDDDAYEATKDNLQDLGLDYADLVLIHRPPDHGVGVGLWEGLIKAHDEGLTRDIGVSNYSIEQMEELIDATDEVPVANQIEWTPFGHSMDMLEWADDNNVIIQAYSTLTRTARLGEGPVKRLAKKYGKTPAQVIIRWNIQHNVVPLIKASTQEHIKENLNVFDFELDEEDMTKLDSLNEQYSSLGSRPMYI